MLVFDYGSLDLACNQGTTYLIEGISDAVEIHLAVGMVGKVVQNYLLRIGGEIKVVYQHSGQLDLAVDNFLDSRVILVVCCLHHIHFNIFEVALGSLIEVRGLIGRIYLAQLDKCSRRSYLILNTAASSALFTYSLAVRIDYHRSESLQEQAAEINSTNAQYVRIRNGKNINVRKSPSTSALKIGMAKAGERYRLLGVADNGWFEIELEEGRIGYISNRLASIDDQ